LPVQKQPLKRQKRNSYGGKQKRPRKGRGAGKLSVRAGKKNIPGRLHTVQRISRMSMPGQWEVFK